MFFDSFSSKALQSGMDAMWTKMEVHSDNVANYETPGYKAKRVSFAQVMERAQESGENVPVLRAEVFKDTSTSNRVDGNNVNMEAEQIAIWKAQAEYAYAVQKFNEEYTNVRTIISQVGR